MSPTKITFPCWLSTFQTSFYLKYLKVGDHTNAFIPNLNSYKKPLRWDIWDSSEMLHGIYNHFSICTINFYEKIICYSYIRILILIICSLFSAIFNDSCLCFWWNGLIYHAHIKTTITHLRDGQHTISGT